jgi:adenine-specific DNA-methyltransferase
MLKGKRPRFKPYYEDFPLQTLTNGWFDTVRGGFAGDTTDDKTYVVQTLTKVIERCLLMTTDPGDLVLDPTCGSGTTAYVAEQWGRRWITIDTSRVAIALARTRLMAGRFPFYLLADSNEGKKKEAELNGRWKAENADSDAAQNTLQVADLRKGFVYKRVPHVTLKSIANNEEIDAIHAKFQPQLEELRARINKMVGKTWEEWDLPRETPVGATYRSPLEEYWQLRRQRQQEIDASIARHADTEFLYDQPYEDSKCVRVSGPFTVESLSPHRVLAPDDPATSLREDALNTQSFTQMILDNLKVSGVQNTAKEQRLKFDRLEPFAGTWLHGAGEYTDKDGKSRRVAVSIGPELGTVSPEQVKEAAKEAVQGVGFDMLIVCGFAFDPHVSEETKRYGSLTVLPAHMNPDLAMGNELLKKTGAGNLFMVFGEPDLEIKKQDGKVVVTLRGVDVYDPTTGEVRSNSTDDIACWFIDTNYNEETFIVRHAYFTGVDQPYEKLQRTLRNEIDESAWSALYSTTSYPFDPPKSGKIAVKVINHYGDEVLKVYEV